MKRLIAHDQALSEEEQVAEDEAALKDQGGQTVITVPDQLLPAIRQLIAESKIASPRPPADPAVRRLVMFQLCGSHVRSMISRNGSRLKLNRALQGTGPAAALSGMIEAVPVRPVR